MIVKLGQYELKIYLNKLAKRVGICSKIGKLEDRHAVLWDFDDVLLKTIVKSLLDIQKRYSLPEIYILNSSARKYHAYCFTARPFQKVVEILAATPNIDMAYLRLGVVRGYYTLRISERNGISFKLAVLLPSVFNNESQPLDLTYNEYLTSNKGVHNA